MNFVNKNKSEKMSEKNSEEIRTLKVDKMTTEIKPEIRDCLGCRLVSAAGLVGIGGYLANVAFKNNTFLGRLFLSTCSLGFVSLGVARYKQQFPFDKKTVQQQI